MSYGSHIGTIIFALIALVIQWKLDIRYETLDIWYVLWIGGWAIAGFFAAFWTVTQSTDQQHSRWPRTLAALSCFLVVGQTILMQMSWLL